MLLLLDVIVLLLALVLCQSARVSSSDEEIGWPFKSSSPKTPFQGGVPPEFNIEIPSGAVLVSSSLIQNCPGYPISQSHSELGCFADAMAQVACAALHAEGVELWVMAGAALDPDQLVNFFQKSTSPDLSKCVLQLEETQLLKVFVHQEGAHNPWVRDFAPSLAVTAQGKPENLVTLPFKKMSEQAQGELAADIAGMVKSLSGTAPSIRTMEFPQNCAFDWGNWDTDGSGLCLVAAFERYEQMCGPGLRTYLQNYTGCTKIPTELQAMPEQTKHVDIFARMVGPRKVLMTNYKTADKPLVHGSCMKNTMKIAINSLNANQKDFVELNDDLELKFKNLPTPKICYTRADAKNSKETFVSFANVAIIQGRKRRAILFPSFTLDSLEVSKKQHKIARDAWKAELQVRDEDFFNIDVSELMTHGGGPHCLTKQYQFLPRF